LKVALVLLLGTTVASCAQIQHAPQAPYYRTGAATDVMRHPRPGYALMGGGTDLDEAFRWLCDRADGGDLLVLRASGDDAYNPYINGLCKLNSVATVIIPDREAAVEPLVSARIQTASAIFISGGDQSKYTGFWRGTPVETALRDAVKRGIPIGGTSAGLAVLGEYIYSAENDRSNDPDLKSEAAGRSVLSTGGDCSGFGGDSHPARHHYGHALRHPPARGAIARFHGPHSCVD